MATGGQPLQEAVALDAARAAQQERIGQTVLEADLAREARAEEPYASPRGCCKPGQNRPYKCQPLVILLELV
jgi:hypothetical protein